ncbi:MAG: hypothetical protein R8M11_06910 [Gallionella sp.]
MFSISKIFEEKPDHPMYNVDEARKLLVELPYEDAYTSLDEITSWLTSIKDTPNFRPDEHLTIIMLLDETGQKFYDELMHLYLGETHLQSFEDIHLWHGLHNFVKELSKAYEVCLDEYQQAESKSSFVTSNLFVICVRLMRAIAEQMKIEMMHYVDIEQVSWKRLFDCYNFSLKHGVSKSLAFAYPRENLHISPERELLRALILSISSPASMAEDQIEVCSRIITRMVNSFDFSDSHNPDCLYYIDLSKPGAPGRVESGVPSSPGICYFGTAKAAAELTDLIYQHEKKSAAQERRFGIHFTPAGKLTALKHLQIYWGNDHPHRHQERRTIHSAVEIAHGFDTISKLVTHMGIDNAQNISAEDVVMLKERSGISLAAIKNNVDFTPEKWPVSDVSIEGIGGVLPKNVGSWAKIGDLCGIKAEKSAVWWVGTIRSLHADEKNVSHFGIEMLAKKPLSVWLHTLDKSTEKVSGWTSNSGAFGHGYTSVILLPDHNNSYANATILMGSGGFVQDGMFELLRGEKTRNIKLTDLLAKGEDYEQVGFQWLTNKN